MKLCLKSQDLWSVIEERVPVEEDQLTEPQRNILKNKKQKDRKALFQIYQALEISVYERISKAMSAQRAWEILQTTYSGQDQVKKVTIGDAKSYKIEGVGEISFKTKSGKIDKISEVFYVPGLQSNLLSVGHLLRKGFDIHFADKYCTMKKKNHMKELVSKNIVQGHPNIDGISEVCEECQLGKQHRESFPSKSKWESHSPMELVHTDLCGPMCVPSLRASCAIYLINRSSTKRLQNSTPNEAWYEKKPNVTHLKTFGCLAYSHIPDALRTKLDDKSEKYIFIGHSERSKAYKLYNPKTKKKL
ncbi:hypothetical protein ZIOFF_068270 [Zingiber officinale]|uniref:GAG-pre-integrase domain-containing protein n=1 Tax=Zingiber officinale TaxID=94328 RepID=A0A8J5CGW7_ZINOF|nr:hypothetical protein ZIOFF_068270 [Zingiber officinale]